MQIRMNKWRLFIFIIFNATRRHIIFFFLYLFLHTSTSSPLFNQQYTHIIIIYISSQLLRQVNIRKPLLRYPNVYLAMTKDIAIHYQMPNFAAVVSEKLRKKINLPKRRSLHLSRRPPSCYEVKGYKWRHFRILPRLPPPLLLWKSRSTCSACLLLCLLLLLLFHNISNITKHWSRDAITKRF